jgi:hypothetical protein
MKAASTLVSCIALCCLATSIAEAGPLQWDGKTVARLQPPDSNRDCVFFELSGVAQADSGVPTSGAWFAVPRSHYGFKEIYAMLLTAKAMNLPITVGTTGLAAAGCTAFVGVAYVYTTS